MANYEVKHLTNTEDKGPSYAAYSMRGAVKGLVEISPPIEIGEGFTDAVLGKDQNGISLKHVLNTSEVTVVIVEASLYDPTTHVEMIDTATERIADLLDEPQRALDMMSENPFPAPVSR